MTNSKTSRSIERTATTVTTLSKRAAFQRFGHSLRIGRGSRCKGLYAWSTSVTDTKLGDACPCGAPGCALGLTTWGKSEATVLGDGAAVSAAQVIGHVHPWEARGLGKAPFRWLGVTRKVGPLRVVGSDGLECMIGAPGQPMGSCDYCGNGIAECHEIQGSDGRRFIVGCDCVRRVEHKGSPVYTQAVRAAKDAQNEKARARSAAKAKASASRVKELLAALRASLSTQPSAYAWKAEKGETRYDDFVWHAKMCGHAGRVRLIAKLEEIQAVTR